MIQMIYLIIMNHFNQANQGNYSSDKMLQVEFKKIDLLT